MRTNGIRTLAGEFTLTRLAAGFLPHDRAKVMNEVLIPALSRMAGAGLCDLRERSRAISRLARTPVLRKGSV
jgi:hypothetical protein